jgi:hypothetical protein
MKTSIYFNGFRWVCQKMEFVRGDWTPTFYGEFATEQEARAD